MDGLPVAAFYDQFLLRATRRACPKLPRAPCMIVQPAAGSARLVPPLLEIRSIHDCVIKSLVRCPLALRGGASFLLATGYLVVSVFTALAPITQLWSGVVPIRVAGHQRSHIMKICDKFPFFGAPQKQE